MSEDETDVSWVQELHRDLLYEENQGNPMEDIEMMEKLEKHEMMSMEEIEGEESLKMASEDRR